MDSARMENLRIEESPNAESLYGKCPYGDTLYSPRMYRDSLHPRMNSKKGTRAGGPGSAARNRPGHPIRRRPGVQGSGLRVPEDFELVSDFLNSAF